MIKKKGIYIEKQTFGKPFTIVYYDGTYLLIAVNKWKPVTVLYKKYSGTTFMDIETSEKTTITKVVNIWCPRGVNFVCDNPCDFPIANINSLLKEGIEKWERKK